MFWANVMNGQTQKNKQRSYFLKHFIQKLKSQSLKGTKIGRAHGKIQHKIHLKSRHIL